MSKKFTYEKVVGRYFVECKDDYEEDFVKFDYEVDDDDLLEEVVEFIKEDYFSDRDVRQALRCMIKDFDLLDILVECYEDSLKEAFEQEAFDSYE